MTSSRIGSWLLVLSPLSYIVVISLAFPLAAVLLPEGELISELTRSSTDAHTGSWIALNLLQLVPVVIPLGVLLVALPLRARSRGWASAAFWLAALAIAAMVVGVALRIAAVGFTAMTIGEDGRYLVGTALIADLAVVLVATVCLCVALRATGVLGRSAWAIVAIAAAALVYDVVSYPLGLVFPPGAVTFVLWLPLGILLRAARRDRSTRAAVRVSDEGIIVPG